MALSTRHATPSDARVICALLGELGYAGEPAVAQKRLAEGDVHVIVAERDGAVVGLAGYHPIPLIAEGGCFVRITALVVAEGERRRGAARALVEEVERVARVLGASELEVSSGRRAGRNAAHAFYPALGFRDAGETSVVYRKRLSG